MDTLVLKNVKRCTICNGSVDKHQHHYECVDCGAIGDPFIGMMVSAESLGIKKENKGE